jgi:SHS2 domain-containing protein
MMFHSFSFLRDRGLLNILAMGERAASLGRNIKAVTFHELEITEEQTRLVTIITFDV